MPLHSLKEKMVKSTLKLGSKVVSTHLTGTHPEQPLPTSYNGIPFIVGFAGDCLGCALGVCCNFLGLVHYNPCTVGRRSLHTINGMTCFGPL